MEEIYWITRLDYINTLLYVISGLSLVLTAICLVIGIAWDDIDEDKEKVIKKKALNIATYSVIIAIVFSTINIFVPTTKEMLMIYGVGGTYEYLKDSDTAKEIPDKCLKAVDKFLDEYIEEDQKKEN